MKLRTLYNTFAEAGVGGGAGTGKGRWHCALHRRPDQVKAIY